MVVIPPSGRGTVAFYIDIDDWVFPLSFRYTAVGNNHRPWTFKIEFLFCIDEDSK